MSDFATAWELSRSRFLAEIAGLPDAALRWKPTADSLSIGQMALHVAGVEISFATQLKEEAPTGIAERLRLAATDGVVNDRPFPFADDEIDAALLDDALAQSRAELEVLINAPTPELRLREIVSALGPIITGEGAFARLAFHPAYHQGQAYFYKQLPGFPSN